MGVPLYTTPTFVLTFGDDIDLTTVSAVYVTFRSKDYVLTKTDSGLQIEPHKIGVHLTQDETACMAVGFVQIQANWIDMYGNRVASEIATCSITDQLLKQVITT